MSSSFPDPGTSVFAPDQPLESLGHEKLDALDEVTPASPPTGAMYAMIHVEAGSVRYLDTPVTGDETLTTTDGILLATGTYLWFNGCLAHLRFLETESSSIVQIIYYKT